MKLELLSIARDPMQPRYSAQLLATYFDQDGNQTDHFAHFTIRFSEEEIAGLPLDQIEAHAIDKIQKLA